MKKISTIIFMLMISYHLMGQWDTLQKTGMAVSPSSLRMFNDTLFAVTNQGLYFSASKNGDDWSLYNNLSLNTFDFDITSDGFQIAVVYNVANKSRIIKRNGNNWDTLFAGSTKWLNEFYEHQDKGKKYWFASAWNADGIYRSADSGATWTLYNTISANEDLTTAPTTGLAEFSSNRLIASKFLTLSNDILVCAYKNVLQYSTDNGLSWHWRYGDYMLNTEESNIGRISERSYNGQKYFFMSTDVTSASFYRMGHCSISIDSLGVYWTEKGSDIPINGASSVSHVSAGDSLIFATGKAGMNVSYNNGDNFSTSIVDNLTTSTFGSELYNFDDFIYVTNNGNTYRYSLKEGINWTKALLADTTYNSINFQYNASRYGNLYYVVLPEDSLAPSRTQILNGKTAGNITATIKGNTAVIKGINAFTLINGLSDETNYVLYSVIKSKVLTYSTVINQTFRTKAMPTSIANYNDFNLKVYPNPTCDYLFVETTEPCTISIVNTMGILERKLNNIEGSVKIDINHLSKGAYIIIIEGNTSTKTQKIVIY